MVSDPWVRPPPDHDYSKWIEVPQSEFRRVSLDRVDRAVSFDVLPADVAGSAVDPKLSEGVVAVEFSWLTRSKRESHAA